MTLHDLPDALLKAILRPLATLLYAAANNDPDAAWKAALQTVTLHDPHSIAELRLAVRIETFSIQANEAAAQAGTPDMPLLRAIRLRSGAVALSREAEKAEHRLEKLRSARHQGAPEPAEPPQEAETASVQRATALVADTRKIAAYAASHGLSFGQALKQRNREQRLAERQAKQAARLQSMATPAPA